MFAFVKKWNTLRNQLLIVFLLVIVIVLVIVGFLTFNQVSILLKDNAEKQIKQVAIEKNGRLESLYEQVNMITKLIMTNADVQRLLLREKSGGKITFRERQKLMDIVNTLQAHLDGIYSVELYTNDYNRVIPLDNTRLSNQINPKWIDQADKMKGKMVWIGQDPKDAASFITIRRVNLIEDSYSNGGYLIGRVNKNYFEFMNDALTKQINELSILIDKQGEPIISNYLGDVQLLINSHNSTLKINGYDYIVTKQASDITGWTLIILTPLNELTKGISALRTSIIVSGFIGVIIFFICTLFLSTLITKPIIKLTNTMRQASEGALTINPDVTSTYELSELNQTYNQLVKETNHLIEMVYEKELIKSRTELKALQAQINPHFLFNTLDALNWSLEEKGEEELAELVVKMSGLFRYTINRQNNGEWVSIMKEMEHIEHYLGIMRMRFGERLTWEILIPPEWGNIKIPKLLIQPLVENAVIHGAGNKIGKCKVSVIVGSSTNEGYLTIHVQDNGSGMEKETIKSIFKSMEKGNFPSDKGHGIALINVNKRLDLYYKKDQLDGIHIESEINKGTRISFDIPIIGGGQ